MGSSLYTSKGKQQIQVKNVYLEQGKDFKEILEGAIKNIISSGDIQQKMLKLNQKIVIKA